MSVLEINAMRQKRAKAIHEARAILENAEIDGRSLTGDEEKQYDGYLAEAQRLYSQITRAEEIRRIQHNLEQPQNDPVHRSDPQQQEKRIMDPKSTFATDEYRNAFWMSLRGKHQSMTPEESRALSIGTASAGGNLVPTEFDRTLVMALENNNVMRALAKVITSSGDHEIPVVTSHGTASWTGEAAAYTESDEVFDKITLSGFKAASLIKVSEELLNDSAFNLDQYIAAEFGRRVGALEETAFVNGTGSGQPTGVIGRSTVGKVGISGQTTSIIAEDLIDVFYALKQSYRSRAVWLMKDGTAKAVSKLREGGTTGAFLWQPGLHLGDPDTIKGRPVHFSDAMPAMAASAKSILFGDFSYYWIADRGGRSIQRLNELYAANGQVGFKIFQRVDGNLTLTETVKHYQNAAS